MTNVSHECGVVYAGRVDFGFGWRGCIWVGSLLMAIGLLGRLRRYLPLLLSVKQVCQGGWTDHCLSGSWFDDKVVRRQISRASRFSRRV